MAGIIFDDIFRIEHTNLEGKFFDRVSRVHAHSETMKMDLILDINCWIYSVKVGDKIHVVVATTIFKDGAVSQDPDDVDSPTNNLANDYEYVMYGKVFRMDEAPATNQANSRTTTYLSFGGLLMQLHGNTNQMHGFDIDQNLYLLIKKLEP